MERAWKRLVVVKTSHSSSSTPPPSISRVPSKMLVAEYIFQPFSPAVKKAIRGGIPSHLRPAAWFFYSGGVALRSQYPSPTATYESFLMQPKPAAFFMLTDRLKMDFRDLLPTNQLIRKDYFSASNSMINEAADVGRVRILNDRSDSPETVARSRRTTIAGLENDSQSQLLPSSAPFLSRLYNIMVAFFIFRPKVEYCRSICTLAATLLLVIQDEERTFWTLSALFSNYAAKEDISSLNDSVIQFEDFRPNQNSSSSSLPTSSTSSLGSSKEVLNAGGFKYFPPTMFKDTSTCGYANRDGFASILAQKKPNLAAKLKKFDIPIALIATNWFQCLFIDAGTASAGAFVNGEGDRPKIEEKNPSFVLS